MLFQPQFGSLKFLKKFKSLKLFLKVHDPSLLSKKETRLNQF